jgi:hypothetical protein
MVTIPFGTHAFVMGSTLTPSDLRECDVEAARNRQHSRTALSEARHQLRKLYQVAPISAQRRLSMANCYFAKPHGMQHYIRFFMLLIPNGLLVLARHSTPRAPDSPSSSFCTESITVFTPTPPEPPRFGPRLKSWRTTTAYNRAYFSGRLSNFCLQPEQQK